MILRNLSGFGFGGLEGTPEPTLEGRAPDGARWFLLFLDGPQASSIQNASKSPCCQVSQKCYNNSCVATA